MSEPFTMQLITTNGVQLRVAVEGTGPLVILVHGWPELWYSWRHQIKPLANAGFRVVVPDVRGYGGSDKPHLVDAYDMRTLMGDLVGIIDHFGQEQAILIGHDWGAPICWNTAALHPDRVTAVAGLSVPYSRRGPAPPMAFWNAVYAGKFFYQRYFQAEGVAEAELERDVRRSLRKIYYSISGDAASYDNWLTGREDGGLLELLTDPEVFPNWMTAADLDYFVDQFSAGGFRGPLNRYRNQDRDCEMLPQMGRARITQPACFIAGSKDMVRNFVPGHDLYATPDAMCDDLRIAEIIEGKGHWIQQEAPEQVNAHLLRFLSGLG
jgi:pimeloyl-ACP methyl ester carboxylesterase